MFKNKIKVYRVKGRVSVLEAHYNIFKNSKVKSHILKMVKERAYK